MVVGCSQIRRCQKLSEADVAASHCQPLVLLVWYTSTCHGKVERLCAARADPSAENKDGFSNVETHLTFVDPV